MSLPTELWVAILKNLSLSDFSSAYGVCKLWKLIIREELDLRIEVGLRHQLGFLIFEIPFHEYGVKIVGERTKSRTSLPVFLSEEKNVFKQVAGKELCFEGSAVMVCPEMVPAVRFIFPDVIGNRDSNDGYYFQAIYHERSSPHPVWQKFGPRTWEAEKPPQNFNHLQFKGMTWIGETTAKKYLAPPLNCSKVLDSVKRSCILPCRSNLHLRMDATEYDYEFEKIWTKHSYKLTRIYVDSFLILREVQLTREGGCSVPEEVLARYLQGRNPH
jgi:hypothetical protein